MISRNRGARPGIGAVVEQRLDVAADRGQRRAQLVRDVGHEVAPHAICLAQLGDVVQDQHRAARAFADTTGALRAMMLRSDSRGSDQLEARGGAAGEGRAEPRGDIRVANDLEIVPAFDRALEPQHPPRRGVHQLDAPLLVDDQDAFDHPAEDGFHPGPIRLEIDRAAPELAHRVVQRAGDDADLVGARSRATAARDRRRHSVARPRRSPGDGGSGRSTRPRPGPAPPPGRRRTRPGPTRRTAASCSLMLVSGSDEPDFGDERRVGVADADRDVEHRGGQAWCCSAGRCRGPRRATATISGRVRVVLERSQRRRIELRIADDRAVGGDERDPRVHQATERVGFGVELLGRRGAAMGERLGGQARFVDESGLDGRRPSSGAPTRRRAGSRSTA